jgi:hypothetical protein
MPPSALCQNPHRSYKNKIQTTGLPPFQQKRPPKNICWQPDDHTACGLDSWLCAPGFRAGLPFSNQPPHPKKATSNNEMDPAENSLE